MELMRDLKIADIEGGAIIERLELELEEAIEDCFDVNKVADSVREISCKIKIMPDPDRSILLIGIETGNKLGKRHPVMSKAFLDRADKKAYEPTAKEIDMFENQVEMTVIGGEKSKKEGV